MSRYPNPGQDPQQPPHPGYSQQPSPYAIPNYYGGGGVPANRRPQAVTAVAIIGIVLGALSVLCTGPSFLLNLSMLNNGGKNPLAPQLPLASHAVCLLSVVQTLGNFILALIMLVCCIAALGLKPFARRVLVPWSYVTILWAIAVVIATITWLMPEMQKGGYSPFGSNPQMQGAEEIGKIFGAILTGAVMCTVPVCILILWRRPHVRAAFGENVASAPSPYPGAWPPAGGQM